MGHNTLLQWIEIIFAVAALAYGIFEHRKRQKLAGVLKTITKTLPGEVAKIEQSCRWGSINSRDAHQEALKIQDSVEKQKILKFLNDATANASSSSKLCVSLFNHLLALQEAQFGTRNISFSEKDTLDLCKDEMRNSNLPTTTKAR